MSVLFEFLQGNRIDQISSDLPLMHTSRARHLRKFIEQNKIIATECDVFKGENLNYFFVGRPAYKFPLAADAKVWEFPICFIMKYDAVSSLKRVFPFDSGGFETKRFPQHLTDHDLEEFDVSGDPKAARKLIGTFFGSTHAYYEMKSQRGRDPISKNDVSLLNSEVYSLHSLSIEKNVHFEDRQFAIEYQTEEEVSLTNNKLLAAIVPAPYMDDVDFIEAATNVWKCEMIAYPIMPLNPEFYFQSIYVEVEAYLSNNGYFS